MKKLLIVFIAIWVQSAYAQKKVDLFNENEKIHSLLNSNYAPISFPDSIALYSFYIKITPKKNGIKSIFISNDLGKKYFGNIDSLFKKVDFNIFLKGTKQKHVIVPVTILIYEHQNMKPNEKLDIWGLRNILPQMMANDDLERYKAVFLNTYFVIVSTKIYN
ncbi:hypothetical protein [Pedobacter sp. SL55]|uniref:hypothetical protein n=1 Tax=Pedobacter sp. SL55 TaxID=2995161 RepID=UPI00226F2935|nr:hypothetical protein [Pedobacter sp. SL55]WAC41194.1 hypothetical protein OVA16_02125 [Pedobacter sp. SL55]